MPSQMQIGFCDMLHASATHGCFAEIQGLGFRGGLGFIGFRVSAGYHLRISISGYVGLSEN